jgi:multidrug efflux system outer membrane protein
MASPPAVGGLSGRGPFAGLAHLRLAALLIVLCLTSGATRAQAAPSATAPQDTPAAAVPYVPPEDDPLLTPPAPAPRTIASWEQALSLIRAQSPDYRSGAEAVRRAAAQREIALAAVLPVVNAQGTYTHQFLSPIRATLAGLIGDPASPQLVPFTVVAPAKDVFGGSGTISWTAVNPRGIYGVGTSNRAIEAAQLTFQNQRRQIATSVVDAMLATLAATRVAELNRVGLRASLDRLALTKARLEFGQGAEIDVDRATQDVATARSAVVSGDEALRRAREALGLGLGSSVAMASPEGDSASFDAAVARTCKLNDDIDGRPDVAAARKRVEIAQRAVTDAALMFAPSLQLSSSLGYNESPVLAPNTTWSATAVVNVPIYDGGVRYGTMRDARAALEQARQALVQTRLAAIVASAQARRNVIVLEQTRDLARVQRDAAARVDTRTREGYARGLGTSLDLVISGQSLRQADINLAILEFQMEDAHADAVLVDAECVY